MEIEQVKKLVLAGKTYEEISTILKAETGNDRGYSARSIRRFCHDNQIDKKHLFSNEQVDKLIKSEVGKVMNFMYLFL